MKSALWVFCTKPRLICLSASLSLVLPNSFIEPMWRLNPRARAEFAVLGWWAIILFLTVGICCATAAIGLWRGARYGH